VSQDLHQDIEKWNEEFVMALHHGEGERAASLFTDHAVIVPPGSARAVFAPNLNNYLKQLSGWTLVFHIKDVSLVCEGVAREVGIMKLAKKAQGPAGGRPGARTGGGTIFCQYLGVFQRVEGVWRCDSWIWNRAAQPQAGQPKRAVQPRGEAGGRAPYVPRLG